MTRVVSRRRSWPKRGSRTEKAPRDAAGARRRPPPGEAVAEEEDDETRLLRGTTAANDAFSFSFSFSVRGRDRSVAIRDDAALRHLRQHGWDAHTIVAASSYAGLAFIAIGYDEILPVYAATREDLGGLSLSASQIGLVLVVGGVALILFQLFAFPLVLKRLGVTKALRRASLAFACVALLAPVARARRRRKAGGEVVRASRVADAEDRHARGAFHDGDHGGEQLVPEQS